MNNDKRKILIIGCGGHGKIVLDIILENNWEVVGFIDDRGELKNTVVNGYKVLGNFNLIDELINAGKADSVVIAIGNNRSRKVIYEKCLSKNYNIVNAVHPSAVIAKNVKLGKGVVIVAGVIINTNSFVGDNVIINTGATIDHDNYISSHVQVCPGSNLAGNVKVGELTFIGTSTTINPNLEIGSNSIIGSGSVVIGNIPDDVTVVGVPAKIIKKGERE